MMSTTFFTYMWTNNRNGKKYIGSHIGDINDNYKGSGKYFKRAYKKEPENFSREIIEYYNTKQEMIKGETLLLKKVNAMYNLEYYNLTNKYGGGDLHSHLSETQRLEIYRKWHEASMNKIANMTDEERNLLKLKKQESWKVSPLRILHSEKTSKRRIDEEANKTQENKNKFSETCKNAYWSRTDEQIIEQHKRQSIGVKKSYEQNPDLLKQRTEHLKSVNIGRIYINKDGKSKRIYPEEKQKYIDDGWELGMAKKRGL